MKIKDVCELCDETLNNNILDTYNYCSKCNEQKIKEKKVERFTNVNLNEIKRNLN